ncbi:MAG: hypothetical protein AB7S71_09140 [Dongiaceae bacterium]
MATVIRSRKLIDLLRSVDPAGEMLVSILNAHTLGMGSDPLKPARVIDLSSENARSPSADSFAKVETSTPAAGTAPSSYRPTQRIARHFGTHWFELNGRRTDCRSVKDLLMSGLRAIEAQCPGTLDNLSHLKKRTKRIVARNRNDLFSQTHLVDDYSEQLMNGWWVGTNNSSDETEAWLRLAASHAGLDWGTQFRTSL